MSHSKKWVYFEGKVSCFCPGNFVSFSITSRDKKVQKLLKRNYTIVNESLLFWAFNVHFKKGISFKPDFNKGSLKIKFSSHYNEIYILHVDK
jgi:hypothetical protein